MKKLNSDKRGFSLVEVIVAVVILGIIVVPLMHTLLTGAKTARLGMDTEKETNAAQSLMELVKAKGVGVLYEDEEVSFPAASTEITSSPTDKTKKVKISGFSSGGSDYDAELQITPVDTKNTDTLSKNNPMDVSFDMKNADNEAKSHYSDTCSWEKVEHDEDGNVVDRYYVYPDTDMLKRTAAGIKVTRVASDVADAYDYTVTAAFEYEAGAYTEELDNSISFSDFSDTVSSTATLKGVKATQFGDAAFSVYLLYDAYFAGNKTENLTIENYSKTDEVDADFNVFLVSSSTKSAPTNYGCKVEYRCQRFKDGETVTRVFTNIPKELVSYTAYSNNTSSKPVGVSGLLVEQAAQQRRFLVSVLLYAKDGTELLWQLDSEMMV